MQPLLLVWILLIGAMFYFLMIKPQKKARAQQVDMLSHLKVGAEVRTTSQIMGTVVELGDDYAVVETTPGVLIKFGKPAIVGIVLPDEPDDAEVSDAAESTDAQAVADAVPADAESGDLLADAATGAAATDAATAPKADAESVSKS
jgi:preprotein translocase subunit YajC